MDELLTDLEHIRKRPGMYVGNTHESGLLQVFEELLDNSIDQFLINKATSIRVKVDGPLLEFTDDGPGLPFDVPHQSGGPLASVYLTEIRRDAPTADGHTPHVHLSGWGCGLRVVTALTRRCEVVSWNQGHAWRQRFTKGLADAEAEPIEAEDGNGTIFRLEVDRDIFSTDWCAQRIDRRLSEAAHLFPGLHVETPTLTLCARRGLAKWALDHASEINASQLDRVWWINEWFGDLHIQAALVGQADSETQWRAFANGSTEAKDGSHLTALQQVVSACHLKPAVGMIHVIMRNPQFSGPTRSRLNAPDLIPLIYQALEPRLRQLGQEHSSGE